MSEQNEAKIIKPTLWALFINMFYISACTFGGGFVIASFIKKKFVDQYHWIDEDEMTDYIAIAQSCPGAIAVNAAILAGWHILGLPGMIVAVLGTILPPMIILSVISVFYELFAECRPVALLLHGMQAGVAAVILDVVINLSKKIVLSKQVFEIFIMFAAFIAVFVFKINVMLIVLGALLLGITKSVYVTLKGGKAND